MTNWRHSAASPPCGSLVCARFIQLDRADAEHWHFLIESLRAGVPERVPCGQAASLASETTQTESACAPVAGRSDGWRLAFDRRAGFGKRPGGEPVPSHLAGIHDVRQAGKRRVGEPICADGCQIRSVFYVIILIDPPSR